MSDRQATIVGSGFAGLAAAFALQKRGIDDITILERANQVGGTWRDNVNLKGLHIMKGLREWEWGESHL